MRGVGGGGIERLEQAKKWITGRLVMCVHCRTEARIMFTNMIRHFWLDHDHNYATLASLRTCS